MRYVALSIVLVQALGACSRPLPPARATAEASPAPSASLRDPLSVSDPAEQQRVRDENTRLYQQWNYRPAEKKAYHP